MLKISFKGNVAMIKVHNIELTDLTLNDLYFWFNVLDLDENELSFALNERIEGGYDTLSFGVNGNYINGSVSVLG